MRKIAIMLHGPPGSGKGTQADLLTHNLGLVHLDAGQILEEVFYHSRKPLSAAARREKRLFESGKLVSEAFVLKLMRGAIERVARAGFGLVLSGQPRRVGEAEVLMPLLARLYGHRNVFFFTLELPEAISIARNSNRLICRTCGRPFLSAYAKSPSRRCRLCGGSFYRRTVDSPVVIKVRLREYEERTKPVFGFAKKHKFFSHSIDGRPSPARVFEKIHGYINKDSRRN